MRTAFVFAGGGSVGSAEVGMLRALIAHGVYPSFVVGASAGAINALHFASNPTAAGVELLAQMWIDLEQSHVFPLSRLHSVMALMGRRPSLLDPEALKRTLAARITARSLEETQLPCHIVTTDFASGAEVVLSSGDALEALLASAAVPVLFPPRRINAQLLTDGGIASNAPISAAIRLGADRVIVLPTGFPCAVRAAPTTLAATVMHTFSLLVARQLVSEIPACRRATVLRIVPPLCPMRVAAHDFSQARELIASATSQTEAWIASGGLDSDATPEALHAHAH